MLVTKYKTSLFIAVILSSLVGLAVIQINWLNKAIATNGQIFAQKMDKGAKETGDFYRNTDNLPINVHNLLSQSKVNPDKINSLIMPIIDKALELNNLPLNYEYGIYKHKGNQYNKLVFGTTDLETLESSECNKNEDRTFGWSRLTCNLGYENGNSYHLAIFPSYKSYIINEVKYSLLAFIFFLALILLGFNYLLKIINKQKKVSEIKNDFINNLTHEFKTPIFSMSLVSKALRKSFKDDDKRNSYVDVLDNENSRLKMQVDKILQLSLVDTEIFQLQKKQIDIHEQLTSVIENLKLVLNEKNVDVIFNFNADNAFIWADEIHLKNVWYNIFDNAIKYSGKEPIITIDTINSNNSFLVSIMDNGIGMTSDKQKMIFDKFYRISTGNIYSTKGFGIGLSYAKRIIELHKGFINVTSKTGLGSTFKIELPINEN